jgi:hypothetical protein
MNIPAEFRLVTPTQLAEGYYEVIGGVLHHRDFVPLETRPDGNIVVMEPQIAIKNEESGGTR